MAVPKHMDPKGDPGSGACLSHPGAHECFSKNGSRSICTSAMLTRQPLLEPSIAVKKKSAPLVDFVSWTGPSASAR
jgi:hypothetical protein